VRLCIAALGEAVPVSGQANQEQKDASKSSCPTEINDDDLPVLEPAELTPMPSPRELAHTPGEARPSGRSRRLAGLLADPDPSASGSRFDADAGVVFYTRPIPTTCSPRTTRRRSSSTSPTSVEKEHVI
jgi:hypothetical protein